MRKCKSCGAKFSRSIDVCPHCQVVYVPKVKKAIVVSLPSCNECGSVDYLKKIVETGIWVCVNKSECGQRTLKSLQASDPIATPEPVKVRNEWKVRKVMSKAQSCPHCQGFGGKNHPAWYNKHPEGMCFYCKGEGVTPDTREKVRDLYLNLIVECDQLQKQVNGVVSFKVRHTGVKLDSVWIQGKAKVLASSFQVVWVSKKISDLATEVTESILADQFFG